LKFVNEPQKNGCVLKLPLIKTNQSSAVGGAGLFFINRRNFKNAIIYFHSTFLGGLNKKTGF